MRQLFRHMSVRTGSALLIAVCTLWGPPAALAQEQDLTESANPGPESPAETAASFSPSVGERTTPTARQTQSDASTKEDRLDANRSEALGSDPTTDASGTGEETGPATGEAVRAEDSRSNTGARPASPCFHIKTIQIQGVSLLPRPVVEAAVKPHLQTCMDAGRIERLLRTLLDSYRRSGFTDVRIGLPPQNIAEGKLVILVIETPPSRTSPTVRKARKRVPRRRVARPVPGRLRPACLPVRQIDVVGNRLVPARDVNAVIRSYSGRCLKLQELEKLTQDISSLFIERGYITTRAVIPPQDAGNGRLVVKIVEGRLERTVYREIRDGKKTDGPDGMVFTSLPIGKGDLLRLPDLEQALAQINRVPSSQATINIKPGLQPGGSVLEITNRIDDPVRFHSGISHSYSKGLSSLTADFRLEVDNLFAMNDMWRISLSSGRHANTLTTSLSFPMGYWTFGASTYYNEQLTRLSSILDYYRRESSITLTADWAIHRGAMHDASLTFSFSNKWHTRYLNGIRLSPQKLTTAGLSLSINAWPADSLALAVSLGIEWGLPILGATPDTDDRTSPKSTYIRLTASGSLTWKVFDDIFYYGSFYGQHSGQTLYSTEHLYLGGSASVRGFGGVAVSGETGLWLRNELLFSLKSLSARIGSADPLSGELKRMLSGMQPYLFLDAGHVRNHAENVHWSMLGSGFGLRLDYRRLSLDASIARGLARSRHVLPPDRFEINASVSFKVF